MRAFEIMLFIIRLSRWCYPCMLANLGLIYRKQMIVGLLKCQNLYIYIELEIMFGKPSRKVNCWPRIVTVWVLLHIPFQASNASNFIIACFFVIAVSTYLHFYINESLWNTICSIEGKKSVDCIWSENWACNRRTSGVKRDWTI